APCGDLIEITLAGDAEGLALENIIFPQAPGGAVLFLDQQPVGPAVVACAHPCENPTAVKLPALQAELELAAAQPGMRVADRLPLAAIPEQDGSGAVLALGNGPFEGAVFDRVVFDLHGEPLLARVQAGAFGHGPTQQDAI